MKKNLPHTTFRRGNHRRAARTFSLGLALALLVQAFAVLTPVYAQKGSRVWRPPTPRPIPAPAPDKLKTLSPEERAVESLGVVDMKTLSVQQRVEPVSTAPTELRPVHVPKEAPAEGRPGVAIGVAPESNDFGQLSPIQSVPSPPVTYSFKSDHLTLGSIPPDTMGAVGPNHAVTTTNEKVVIHQRNGVILSVVTLDAFFAVTPNGIANPSTFDPKIYYDRFIQRWFLVATVNAQNQNSGTVLATSQTADPTGLWNRYFIKVDPAATAAGGRWADYPSVGYNNQWITIQINRFGYGTVSGFQGPSIYVIQKATAYAGTLGTVATFEENFSACLALNNPQQAAALSCGFTMVPAITEDNTTTTHYLVEDWDSQAGQLRMSRLTGPANAPVLTVGYQFPQSPYSWRFNAPLVAGTGGYLPQRQQNIFAPSGNRPTANDSRIQNAVLRNGRLWSVHHVMLARTLTQAGQAVGGTSNPDIRTAVQWWETDPTVVNPTSGTPPIQRNFIVDMRADNCHNGNGAHRTTGPCTGTATQVGDFYAYTNIAVNANNDVVIGYSRFSPLTLPKAAYSFRAGTDLPNTMRDSQVFREGMGNYNIGAGSPFNIRWGDYSASMVDPVNDIDFWTIQEYALDQREIFGPGGFAGLWSTWWGRIQPNTAINYANTLLITELRLRGPNGVRDEFVELYNPTSNFVIVHTTDGSDGWTVAYSSPSGTVTPLATIPNGTIIPPNGFFLVTNEVRAVGIAPYSLSASPTGHPARTADGDAMWTPDLADNGGIALFRTANQNNFIDAARVDSVGHAALAAGSVYREGAGLPNCAGAPNAQMSFVRKAGPGGFQDTNDNAADFNYVSTNDGAQTYVCGAPALLGSPTPCNRDAVSGGGACTGPGVVAVTAPSTLVMTPSRKTPTVTGAPAKVIIKAPTLQQKTTTKGRGVIAQ